MKHCYKLIILLSVLVSSSAFAQTVSISGTVNDQSGIPIIGASVTDINDKASGAITDIDGKFSITADENTVLEISCIGYESQQVKVEGQKTINVILLDNAEFDEMFDE